MESYKRVPLGHQTADAKDISMNMSESLLLPEKFNSLKTHQGHAIDPMMVSETVQTSRDPMMAMETEVRDTKLAQASVVETNIVETNVDGTNVVERKIMDAAVIDEATILIPALDANGGMFPVEKFQAHKDATHHLAISIFLFVEGKMLLQQRARGKYHSGGLWANACCSHPHWGETIELCAVRRLQEELGCGVELAAHGYVDYYADVGQGMTENERAYIFSGHVEDIDTQLGINLDEVRSIEVFDVETLREKLEKQPGNFTAWFKEYMSRDEKPLRAALEAGGFNWF